VSHSNKPIYEPVITLGNVLQLLVLIIGGVFAWATLNTKVAVSEYQVQTLSEKVGRIERHVAPPYWSNGTR
jgi:hypothetical protein